MALKIAWRNIWRHKGKSFIIGVILLLGSLLMTIGNGMISGMEKGLSENIINIFSGDIVIVSNEQKKDNVLFDMLGSPRKVIKNYEGAKKVLQQEPMIQEFMPAAAGTVNVLNPGSEMGKMMLVGVDLERYRRMFPESFQVSEGRLFKPGERGLLVGEEARKQLYDSMNFWLLPEGETLHKEKLPAKALKDIQGIDIKSDIVIMGYSTSNATMDIRVPVTGIINYKALNKIWGSYSLMDIDSFREAHNYVTGTDSQVAVSAEDKKLLETDETDQYFSSGDFLENTPVTQEQFSVQDIQAQTNRKMQKYNPDAGSYNLVILKLKKGFSVDKGVRSLNELFKKNHLNVRAISWKRSMGLIGGMASLVKTALNMFIIFIFFVAIIVIMNTLSMAAIERTAEIAMMRAVGAGKGFLRNMFVYETGLLSFFFGGIGIVVGVIFIYLMQSANIATTNEMLQLVYGGSRLHPVFTLNDLFIGVVELGIVTFLSVIYPLRVVGKIVPLDAINMN